MTTPPLTTSAAHCAAILSLATKPTQPAKEHAPVIAPDMAQTVGDALLALLPMGTQTAHAATSLPLPPMPLRVGYERTGLPVAMLSADTGLIAALIAHQCGIKVNTEATEPGLFETGFLANLAARLLPVLFDDCRDVAVVRQIDDLSVVDDPDAPRSDTLFVTTILDKPQNRTGRLRLLAPAPSQTGTESDERAANVARITPIAATCRMNVQRLSLQQVADLEEGTVLTLEPAAKAVLTINGKPFAEGDVLESAGSRSFHIANPETGATP